MPYVIFAIDNPHDIHAMAKFTRHVDTLRAMGKLRGGFASCIGYWEGTLEPSFIMDRDDFYDHIKPLGFVDGQICILECNGKDARQPCQLVYADGKRETVPPMRQASVDEAKRSNAWTYRMDTQQYFVSK